MRIIIALFAIALCTSTAFGQKVKSADGEDFGAGIQAKKYVTVDVLLDEMQTQDTVQTTVRATVNEVCQMKGCWMTLDESEIMVRFKDYGFFVPKDIGGSEVIIEGEAFSTVVPVDELRHYAEDAGKSKEEIAKITEPKKTYAFTATGVKVIAEK